MLLLGSIAQCQFEDAIHVLNQFKLQLFPDMLRHFLQIALIFPGQNDGFNAGAMRGQHFIANAADRQNFAAQNRWSKASDRAKFRPSPHSWCCRARWPNAGARVRVSR